MMERESWGTERRQQQQGQERLSSVWLSHPRQRERHFLRESKLLFT